MPLTMRDPALPGPTISVALTLTVGLWLFAGYQFTRRMGEVVARLRRDIGDVRDTMVPVVSTAGTRRGLGLIGIRERVASAAGPATVALAAHSQVLDA
jgi:hypothetical protein